MAVNRANTSAFPISPAWRMRSHPDRNAAASGRKRPWVSEMKPSLATHSTRSRTVLVGSGRLDGFDARVDGRILRRLAPRKKRDQPPAHRRAAALPVDLPKNRHLLSGRHIERRWKLPFL